MAKVAKYRSLIYNDWVRPEHVILFTYHFYTEFTSYFSVSFQLLIIWLGSQHTREARVWVEIGLLTT